MLKQYRYIIILVLPLLLVVSQAQELCEALVREAFEIVTDSCGDLDDANACYGYDDISATFFEAVDDSFKNPSDAIIMEQLQTVHTSPFDEEEEEWGISYFQVGLEASEDPLIVMSAGDVIVENDLEAAADTDLSMMQAFNFTTGGDSDCRQAPNAVYLQGPQDVEVDLTINSTPIRIGSTVVLGTYEENAQDIMWLGVVEGRATIYPDTPRAIFVEEGMLTTTPLTNRNGNSPDGTNILNTGRVPVLDPLTGEQIIGPNGRPFFRQVPYTDFSTPQAITLDGKGPLGWGAYGFINFIPPELVNYDVEVPEPEDTPPTTSQSNTNQPASNTPAEDTQVTECGTQNWCNAGEPWGDGRCNDPDPDLSSWYWNAGWYQAQLECGAIEEIPEEFQNPEPAPPQPAIVPTATPNPLTCTYTDTSGRTRTYNIPPGGFQIGVQYTSIEDSVGICMNVGWWCGGQWTQSIPNVVPETLVSTTCSLP